MRGARWLENSQYMMTAVRAQSAPPGALRVAASTSPGSCAAPHESTVSTLRTPYRDVK